MKYLAFILLALAGCQTIKPDAKTECAYIDASGDLMTVCGLPANVICIEKGGHLSCLQVHEPRSY